MAKASKLDRFDEHIPAVPAISPWQPDGSYSPDYDLLKTLLDVAVGTSQRSGVVAGAVDVWAAEELRRAGFDPDEVWPRRVQPRVMPRDLKNFVEGGLTKKLRVEVEARYASSGARNALPAEAHVMGRAYSKQSDVVVASWAAGVELLISTKTMLSSYQKNLRNRFEEGYGDAKNLRGRHPMAALGFLFITGADIPESSLLFAVDMLRKLTTEPDVYDCACLLVVDGTQGRVEEELVGDDRGAGDEPPALLTQHEANDVQPDDEPGEAETPPPPPDEAGVVLLLDRVGDDLGAEAFFGRLIGVALERMPVAVYPHVRSLRQHGSQ